MDSPDPDLEELYRRAIADPKSMTRAERNAINGWPAPEEEDRLCIAKTGHTRAELVAKALANPDDLTRNEAMIVYHHRGVQFDADNLSLQEMWERHKRDRADVSQTKVLRDEAHRQLWEAMGEEEKVARRNALKRHGPLLWPTFRAVFVEDKDELDGVSDEQLRARFREMRERDGEGGEQLPEGMRTNCFLVADQAAIESEAAQTPYEPRYVDDLCASVRIRDDDPVVYVRAVDPDWTKSSDLEARA